MPLNKDKLAKLQAAQVRTGGKGIARRKKKVVHKTTTDTKKLQSTLKRLGVNAIPGIEEVNMMKDDGNVIHFSNPKVQASLHSNTFAIAGQNEEKPLTDMLPSILNQLMGPDADKLSHFQEFMQSKKTAEEGTKGETGDDDDVPELVENFEEASKDEV